MRRRELLTAAGGTAVALAAPRSLRAQTAKVLKFVPIADLALTDPIVTTSLTTRCHAYLVFDTLYGLDAQYRPVPQMVEGHVVEPDGLTWTLTLREGLRFHSGEPVLARDVVPSLQRWARRDSYGATLFQAVDELSATSDRVLRFRLKRPFALLPDALGKTGPNMAAIMPERLARTDPFQSVKEVIGSGPFRFVAAERIPGSRVVYERFEDYVPRSSGTIGFSSGPKLPKLSRVEWTVMPDAATAANALIAGEVDWVEAPSPDLMPVLARQSDVTIKIADQVGIIPILRFNCLQPPFDNVALRRLVLQAVDQSDVMTAYSSDTAIVHAGVGAFPIGTPTASRAGMDGLFGRTDLAKAQQALKAAGYAGQPVVLLAGADNPVTYSASQVVADLLQRIGFTIDFQSVDSATVTQRRASREPTGKGGWSLFIVGYAGADMISPAESFPLRGNGVQAWFGWPTSPQLEQLRADWMDAADPAARQHIAEQIQLQVWQDVPFVPLGQISQKTAFRSNISGVLDGFAKFYNVDKA